MAQANAIIVRIRADAAEEFERMFEAEELPIWDEFVSSRADERSARNAGADLLVRAFR
jgi:hypothetical protein